MNVGEALAIAEAQMRLGFVQGLDQGRRSGTSEGRLEIARQSVVVVLSARGMTLTSTDRSKIEAQQSPQQLRQWLQRAAICGSVAEVLD